MAATNAQVQAFVNERMRPWAESARTLYLQAKDDKANIDDVYANLTNSPTWVDVNTNNPPTLLTPNDVLAWNAFMTAFIAFVEGNGDWGTVLKACVRKVQG